MGFKSFAMAGRASGRHYFIAVALLAAFIVARAELTPLIGVESPLLVLLVPVVISALLLGCGPAVLIAVLAPIAATMYLHHGFTLQDPWGWLSHVALYEALALGGIFLIQQLRRSSARIQRDQERLRLAIDSAQLGIFELHATSEHFVLGNRRMMAMLELEPSSTPHSLKCSELIAQVHEQDREIARSWMSLSDASPPVIQLRVSVANEWRDIEFAGKRISDGSAASVVGVARDLTETNAERARSALLESIVVSSGDAIFSESMDGSITSWNPAAHALFGYSSEEAIGQPTSLVIPDDLSQENLQLIARAAEGPAVTYATERMRKNGRRLQVSVTISAIRNSEGAITGYCRIVRDISEHQRALREIARSEQRFQQLADAMPQIVYVLDAQRNVRYLNRRWREYTGYDTTDDAINKQVIPEEDLQRLYAEWNKNSATLQPYTVEFRLRSRTGELRWFLRRAAPILNENGTVDMWIGTSTDIHEQKQIQNALVEADKRKDEFLAMLAHELRNPLAPMLSIASILEHRASDVTAVQQMGGILKRQTAHLARLVDDLLDVSRITRGKINLKQERLILQTVLERALEGVHPRLIAKSQAIKLAVPQRPVVIEGDLVRLTQVLVNLLSNASKFSPNDCTIHVSIETTGNDAHIGVRDPGVGIDRQFLPHVFELFVQADQSLDRSQGGLGIGLTIVKRLVELHGGHIEARSEGINAGSEFVVTLPLAEIRSVPTATSPQLFNSRKRIVIVDDNADAALSLQMLLEFEGHEVRTVHEARSALKLLEQFTADVAIVDIGLPDIDGYALAELIRQRFGERLRIIALSGYAPEESLRQDKRFNAHLIKPVEMEVLISTINSLSTGESVI